MGTITGGGTPRPPDVRHGPARGASMSTNTRGGEIREIRTLVEFETLVAAGAGFIVVTDRSTPTHVHEAKCPALGKAHFLTKVVTNACRRGRYYFAPTFESSMARFPRARPCGVCRPGVRAPTLL